VADGDERRTSDDLRGYHQVPSGAVTDLAPAASSRVPDRHDRCDGPADPAARLLVVLHEDDAGPGRLAADLPALDLRRPYDGDQLPADLTGYDGLLVLGGSMGAWDDDAAPWLPATRRLLADGVERGVPTLGICLGAQLLAAATGGQVRRGDAGLEVGLVPVRLLPEAADDALFGALVTALADAGTDDGEAGSGVRRVDVPQWHQDAVTDLPPGAVLLATGERYPHQAFRLGRRAWGLQYHPEVTLADFDEWMRTGHGAVRAHGLQPEAVMRRFVDGDAELGRIASLHARAFAALLTPAG
jgi:GMP synthase (glutamine-hydrolysing)